MLVRELIFEELWRRMALVTGVTSTARNPINPPAESDLPRINLFELSDEVDSASTRGRERSPVFKRTLTILLECFTVADSEAATSKTLWDFVEQMKIQLYSGGNSLGMRMLEVMEVRTSEVYRPPDLEKVAGVGIELEIAYVEDISTITGSL